MKGEDWLKMMSTYVPKYARIKCDDLEPVARHDLREGMDLYARIDDEWFIIGLGVSDEPNNENYESNGNTGSRSLLGETINFVKHYHLKDISKDGVKIKRWETMFEWDSVDEYEYGGDYQFFKGVESAIEKHEVGAIGSKAVGKNLPTEIIKGIKNMLGGRRKTYRKKNRQRK